MSAPGVRRRPGPAGDPCGLLLSPSKFPRGERAHAPAAAADGCDPDSPRVEDRFGRRPPLRGGPPSRLPPDATVVGIASGDRKSTRLNTSHVSISYAVFCLKKKSD